MRKRFAAVKKPALPFCKPRRMKYPVFLDLDDTILDFHRAEDVALRKTLTSFGLTPTDAMVARYSAINDACWKRLERGEMTRDEVLTKRFALFFDEMGVSCDPEETWRRYEANIGEGGFLLAGARELLEELSETYDLYAVSNGTATIQDKRIARADIARYFKAIFISQRVGYNKPDKRFFDLCFAELPPFDKTRTAIIGDSLTSDICGGKNAGIPTIWYNPHNHMAEDNLRPDYEVSSLDMIPLVLEMLLTSSNEDANG